METVRLTPANNPNGSAEGQPHDQLNAEPDQPYTISDYRELADPRTALRFRMGMEYAYLDQQGWDYHKTRRLLETYGVDTASSIDNYATAQLLNLTEEQWLEQREGKANHIDPQDTKYLDKFKEYMQMPHEVLLSMANQAAMADQAKNPPENDSDKDEDPLAPFMVATGHHEKYLDMSAEDLDQAVRTEPNPREQMRLLKEYLLPRIGEQVEVLRSDKADEHDKKQAAAIIENIEARLERMGIRRMPSLGAEFDSRLHDITGGITGNGPIWLVADEIKPGFSQGKGLLRKASVSVRKISREEYQKLIEQQEAENEKQKQERAKRAAAAKQAGSQATAAATQTGDFDAKQTPELAGPKPVSSTGTAEQTNTREQQKYNEQLALIKRYEQDSELGHLFDPERLKDLHNEIQREAWPKYKARLAELNEKLRQDGKKEIPTVGKMPAKERRAIIDPISNEHTRAYAGREIYLSDEALRALTLARLKAANKLHTPEQPTTERSQTPDIQKGDTTIYRATRYDGQSNGEDIVDAEIVDDDE